MTKNPRELTADWKARKLKPGLYYVRLSNGNLDVAKLSRFNRFYGISYHFEVEEILAELTNENSRLRQLLRDCDNELKILRTVSLSIASVEAIEECDEILTKINEVMK